jgi:hypothetical protein
VSANPGAGFSIVSYTGNGTSNGTVGHGLNQVPSFIVGKIRSASNDWRVFHKDLTNGHSLYLNRTLGSGSQTNRIANNPTSTTFNPIYIDGGAINQNGQTYIAYCFADIPGYQKAGSYRGNGSTDGAFVVTGFRPAWVMIKASASNESWKIMDNKRDGSFNLNDAQLTPSSSNAESNDGNGLDLLANGFKLRSNIGNWNTSGTTYYYLAIAEQPFKYANAR